MNPRLSVVSAAALLCLAVHGHAQRVSLWGVLSANVPAGVHLHVVQANVGFREYIFISNRDGRRLLTADLDASTSNWKGFFGAREYATATVLRVAGLGARRVHESGARSVVEMKLPRSGRCYQQSYVLLTYPRGDPVARSILRTLAVRRGGCIGYIP